MTDTETEAETLERLELALKRIADLARQPKPAKAEAGDATGPEIDKAALLHTLDLLINRLRNGLELPKPSPVE